MKIDYRKSCLVHMLCKKSGNIAFVLQVYGADASDLMLVPNQITTSLALKYPDHMSSPFMIEKAPAIKRQSLTIDLIRNNSIKGLF